jgi:hypothetical protein
MDAEIEDLDNYSRTLVVPTTNITSPRPETTSDERVNYVSGSRLNGNIP